MDAFKDTTNRNQKLMLFFSADLVGSTNFKTTYNIKSTSKIGEKLWPQIFSDFFNDFILRFEKNVLKYHSSIKLLTIPKLWKINGDEILMKDLVYREEQIAYQIKAFYETIIDLDRVLYSKYGLGLKGCVWTAGFPIRNKEIEIHYTDKHNENIVKANKYEIPDHFLPDVDTGYRVFIPKTILYDYLGIEIDAGFRLAALGARGKIIISIDVAELLTKSNTLEIEPLTIRHIGWKVLKGAYQNNPYPIFFISKENLKKYTPWEGFDNDLVFSFFTQEPISKDKIYSLIIEYRNSLSDLLIEPYIYPDEKNKEHAEIWRLNNDDLTKKIDI